MISIIICSIKPDLCNQLIDNFKSFIGVDCEFIVFDNREKKWGICKAYNYSALKAKYPYLCFIHEDILIKTENWGKILIDFYEKTTDCGIIGFAGGRYAPKNFSSWNDSFPDIYSNYWEYSEEIKDYVHFFYSPPNQNFSEVVALDGLFLFLSKKIYEDLKFDEETFDGFHFYDADISLNASFKYKNYVSNTISIYHRSPGFFDDSYCNNILKFQKKWNKYLPTPSMYKSKLNWFKKHCNSAYGTYFLCVNHHISWQRVLKHLFTENSIFFSIFFVMFYLPFKSFKNIINN